MKNRKNLEEAIAKIFGCDWNADDYDPEGPMFDYAQQILEDFPWEEIFQCAVAYFKEHCSTLDQILNFIDLYTGNGFIDRPIDRPYEFAGMIGRKVDFEVDWENGADRIEDFLTNVLDSSGAISLYADPYYQLLKDPKFLAAVAEAQKDSDHNE